MLDTRPTEVEFDPGFRNMVDAYRHEDGSITYIVWDDTAGAESPRDYDGNVATLINTADRYNDLDTDDAYLSEARTRWEWTDYGRTAEDALYRTPTDVDRAIYGTGWEQLVTRYVAMFRPEILHYEHRWEFSSSQSDYQHGWGYVTQASVDHVGGIGGTFKEAFDAEVDLYRQYCSGEVYGACHVTIGDPIVIYGEQGAYVDEYETEEDWCWDFLGYDDHKDIAWQFTDSPITEVLA